MTPQLAELFGLSYRETLGNNFMSCLDLAIGLFYGQQRLGVAHGEFAFAHELLYYLGQVQ